VSESRLISRSQRNNNSLIEVESRMKDLIDLYIPRSLHSISFFHRSRDTRGARSLPIDKSLKTIPFTNKIRSTCHTYVKRCHRVFSSNRNDFMLMKGEESMKAIDITLVFGIERYRKELTFEVIFTHFVYESTTLVHFLHVCQVFFDSQTILPFLNKRIIVQKL